MPMTVHFLSHLTHILEAIAQISKFTEVSGLKLNIKKTEGMNVGTHKPINHNIFNIRSVNQPVKFLGIYVGQNETDCNEKNGGKNL